MHSLLASKTYLSDLKITIRNFLLSRMDAISQFYAILGNYCSFCYVKIKRCSRHHDNEVLNPLLSDRFVACNDKEAKSLSSVFPLQTFQAPTIGLILEIFIEMLPTT